MKFLRVAPILPVKDVADAARQYARLGFETHVYEERLADGRAFYGFIRRDDTSLHLALTSEVDVGREPACVYVYVDDPDALYAEWRTVAEAGALTAPEDRAWGVREMTYSDPDGNLLRIGCILKK